MDLKDKNLHISAVTVLSILLIILCVEVFKEPKLTDSEQISQAKSNATISINNSICGTLGYNFKSSIQYSSYFIGKKLRKSDCTKREDGLLTGYIYDADNPSNLREWLQLSVDSLVAVDLASINKGINDLVSGNNEVTILHTGGE